MHTYLCTCIFRSQALLYCAASMINQIVSSKSSERRTGYSILTDGHTWRIVVSQHSVFYFVIYACVLYCTVLYMLLLLILLACRQALQLNTLDFDAAVRDPGAVKNAAWVYESELYTITTDGIVINPEVLGILHNIFAADQKW